MLWQVQKLHHHMAAATGSTVASGSPLRSAASSGPAESPVPFARPSNAQLEEMVQDVADVLGQVHEGKAQLEQQLSDVSSELAACRAHLNASKQSRVLFSTCSTLVSAAPTVWLRGKREKTMEGPCLSF